MKQWDSKSGNLLRTFDLQLAGEELASTPRSLFSPDDQRLVCASSGGRVTLWNVESGEIQHVFESGIQWPTMLQFSSTDTVTVGGFDPHNLGYDLKIIEWDIKSGEQKGKTSQTINVASASDVAEPGYPHFRVLAGGPADRTRLSPDLKHFAIGYGSDVLVGEVRTGKLLQHFKSLEHAVVPVQYSDDGRLVAAADQSQTIRVWSAKTGEELNHFEHPRGPVCSRSLPMAILWPPDMWMVRSGFGIYAWSEKS